MKRGQPNFVAQQLARADESLDDARLLAANHRRSACVNRLYYTCFYAATAVLFSKGIETQTHRGCKAQFGLHIVKEGLVDAKQGKLFADLMDLRLQGDYGDLPEVDEQTVQALLEKTKTFLQIIKDLVDSKPPST